MRNLGQQGRKRTAGGVPGGGHGGSRDAILVAALELHQSGRLDEAHGAYERLLARHPDDADALHFLGVLRYQTGALDDALRLISRSLSVRPDFPDALCNLGTVHRARGDRAAAADAFRRALALDANLAQAHNNLGNLSMDARAWREAGQHYRRAIALAPGDPEAHANLARTLLEQGDGESALHAARAAVKLAPQRADMHANLAAALHAAGKLEEATGAYRRALADDEGNPDWHVSLANLLDEQGLLEQALAHHQRALELEPGHGAALSGCLYTSKRLCLWDRLAELRSRFREGIARGGQGLTPFAFLAEPGSPEEQLACARNWAKQIDAGAPRSRSLSCEPREKPRIRIGWVSSGFHNHPTAALTVELFELLDRRRFELYAYSTGPNDGGTLRQRLLAAFTRFRDLRGLPADGIANRVHDDGIDILVDLQGYCGGAVSEVFALRSAPVQVNYLAYPGTMGAAFMDYIVVDPALVRAGEQIHYTEHLVRLPDCYQPNDRQRQIASGIPSRADSGLPQRGFVFCCFNSPYKIGPEVLDLWSDIVTAVPGSVLWLLDAQPDSSLRSNLTREALRRGLAADRLVFSGRLPQPEYLARYRIADLFLDTWPYTAHTTASDALWAGCPVLTCPGETFASRVGASLLRAASLPELIAPDTRAYRATAVRLACDVEELKALRQRLDGNRDTCALFDTPRYARQLERAFEIMYQRRLRGEAAREIDLAQMTD